MIRLINTTTRLPVDQSIEDSFFKIVKPTFLNAVTNRSRSNHVDVQFVGHDDLDLERKRCKRMEEAEPECNPEHDASTVHIPDLDLLGVYIQYHPDNGLPVFKVCPEKVMETCILLKTKLGIDMPLDVLYPTILLAVIIHQLSHSLMQTDPGCNECGLPWQWLAHSLDKGEQYDLRRAYTWLNEVSEISPKRQQWQHVINKSLANAFVLKQNFPAAQLDALHKFIDSQPAAYRAGLHWKCNMTQLLTTAWSWGECKELSYPHLNLMFSEPVIKSPLMTLADRLGAAEKIGSFDFISEFYRHLVLGLPVWQAEFEQDKSKWNEFLNGDYGVLNMICNFPFGLTKAKLSHKQKLKYLRQWASNVSPEAVGQLNAALR